MSTLHPFAVLYRDATEADPFHPPFCFLCQAETADHAEEQCVNAYPDCDVVWIAAGDDPGAAYMEWGNSFEESAS